MDADPLDPRYQNDHRPHVARVLRWQKATSGMFLVVKRYGKFPITLLGARFVLLNKPVLLPPCEAFVRVTIDGRTSQFKVHLFKGASSSRVRVRCVEE